MKSKIIDAKFVTAPQDGRQPDAIIRTPRAQAAPRREPSNFGRVMVVIVIGLIAAFSLFREELLSDPIPVPVDAPGSH